MCEFLAAIEEVESTRYSVVGELKLPEFWKVWEPFESCQTNVVEAQDFQIGILICESYYVGAAAVVQVQIFDLELKVIIINKNVVSTENYCGKVIVYLEL